METAVESYAAQPAVVAPLGLRQLRVLQFAQHVAGDPARAAVEHFVRARFAASHGAQVDHFLPHLISLGHGRRYCAAVGLAAATQGPLFAERYLAAPIEQLIATTRGGPVGRGDVLEIGNLVSSWKGGSLLLFVFLSELIVRLGYRYVLFTATREVERLLDKLGYAPVVLAQADPARLPDGGARWGRYYERGPRVMFGEVPPAVAAARRDRRYRAVARAIATQVDEACATFARHLAQGH